MMLFDEKVSLSQKIIWKYNPRMTLGLLDSGKEEYNYRNKSVYTFNLNNSYLDQRSFDLIDLDHSKMIQFIDRRTNREFNSLKASYGILDVYIKHNWRREFQVAFHIWSNPENTGCLPKLVKYLFGLIKALREIHSLNIVSGYYYEYQKGKGLKDKEFKLFYGLKKLEENLGYGDSIYLSPHSFSRVNYSNSQIIYRRVWELVSQNPDTYMLFGRDVYFPLKQMAGKGKSTVAFTHCPITYRDIQEDTEIGESGKCFLVSKRKYAPSMGEYMAGHPGGKFCFVLTAGRNGLGEKICEMLRSYRGQISQVVYIGCNRKHMDGDLGRLLRDDLYTLQGCDISNEFSQTEYNNNIAWLD